MSDVRQRCLDVFPEWLRALGPQSVELAEVLQAGGVPESVKRYVAGGLNYLFKSLDLIPDGIEDLGYLDDAFVLRVAAHLALADAPALAQAFPVLGTLAAETELVRGLLVRDYGRLEAYVRVQSRGAARGRTVDEILEDAAVRSAFVSDVSAWAASYQAPSFTRDEKNLVKLESFLSAKLPA